MKIFCLCFVYYCCFFSLFLIQYSHSLNVHFENKDGGFFLKQQQQQQRQSSVILQNHPPSSPPASSSSSMDNLMTSSPSVSTGSRGGGAATGSTPLSIDRFTVLQSSQPISVRATYGPFSTKQTVPARYVVPDPVMPISTSNNNNNNYYNSSGIMVDFQDQIVAQHHLDMSAHLVRSEIPRESPVLRVLFHTGTDRGARRQVLFARHHQKVCIILHATMTSLPPLHTACSPNGNDDDGVCLAQITIPAIWWPPIQPPDQDGRPAKSPAKSPPRQIQVAYSVLEPWPDAGENCHAAKRQIQMQPSMHLGTVTLTAGKNDFKPVKMLHDGAVIMLMPAHTSFFPLSRFYLTFLVDETKTQLMTAIFIRVRIKSGLRLLETSQSDNRNNCWNMTVEFNSRRTGATVTLIRKSDFTSNNKNDSSLLLLLLFDWLVEVTDDAAEIYDGARIVWIARFEPSPALPDLELYHGSSGGGRDLAMKKTLTRFDIQKDDIQAVVPISKNWEILNTAILTGQQVSQIMKIFIVSEAGKAADVTFQATCYSEDDNILKVSTSCGSVYVDGSEQRGSVNASILVKYGTYTGLARFVVWMPEFPLDVAIVDVKLSQIKSWRVPHTDEYRATSSRQKVPKLQQQQRRRRDVINNAINENKRQQCRLRYQQTTVDVYAHFMATDQESGRITYLINRRTFLRITDLVLPWLRVSDPRVASLSGRILEGRAVGRAEIQILSPLSVGKVYGSREVRVVNEKVTLTRMTVQVVAGLQLNIVTDGVVDNAYLAETSVTRQLTAQYQEGLLDIELEFSDSTMTALRDISDSDYHLIVESLDPAVVAFAPMVASHHPRVIAVGEGAGELLHVTLQLSDECQQSGNVIKKSSSKNGGNAAFQPLASASAQIKVDFSNLNAELRHQHQQHVSNLTNILQNDGMSNHQQQKFNDLNDILIDALKEPDLKRHTSYYQSINQQNNPKRHNMSMMSMTSPLEISMYVLLAAFCCAILVFVVSCVIYASKFKPSINYSTASSNCQEISTTTTNNAHDWVWLGRAATLETSNQQQQQLSNINDMRIITNPLNVNYIEPDDLILTAEPKPPPIIIDSSTYSVKKNTDDENYRPPVPPHRNLLPKQRNEEIKQAVIVDNTMLSNDNMTVTINNNNNNNNLDGLVGELDMDYEQIMQYFENLKESNA